MGMRNAASVPITRCGLAVAMDHVRLRAPETRADAMPLPRLGIPSTIMAARANVAASAQKSIVSDCCERLSTAPAKAYPAAPAIIVVATRSAFAFPICPAGTRPGIAACRAGCTMALIEARTKRIGMIIHHRAPVDPAALSTWVNMGVTTRIAARMSSSVTISGLRGNLSATPPRTLLIAIVASAWAMKARATIRASWFVAVYINTSVATRVEGWSPSWGQSDGRPTPAV